MSPHLGSVVGEREVQIPILYQLAIVSMGLYYYVCDSRNNHSSTSVLSDATLYK